MPTPSEVEGIFWDAIVIGTGMGGGTLGHELAQRGRRVLFVEKGSSSFPPSKATLGRYPEESFDLAGLTAGEHDEQLARGGRSTDWFEDVTPGTRPTRFRPILGSGTGGSSALYGMVTERFFRADFTPRANFTDVGDSTVPEQWPVTYDEMVPWYRKAELLYRVRGTADPLRPADDTTALLPPPPMTAANAEVASFLTERGMHPYSLHVACEYKDDCAACQAYLCAADCKNDSSNICVEPAVRAHGAVLLTRTRVERLEATRTAVTDVVATRHGETLRLRGKVVVLAAGALMTPVLLMESRSTDWPAGLANGHDLVGRNLMRHFIDVFLIRVRTRESVTGQVKEISANDLYCADGQKLGTFQSMGHIPPYEFFMNSGRRERRLLGAVRGMAGRRWKASMQERLIVMASIAEDLPYSSNRVFPAGGNTAAARLQYTIHEPDRKRRKELTRRLGRLLGRYRGSMVFPILLRGGAMNSALGHVCGTARFGDDPRTSVLDRNNRAWELDNLYVVDTSMLPSSGGINPSLTVAANALRVAEVIDDSL